jgi:bifunctional non-homologous end joining protein LigD
MFKAFEFCLPTRSKIVPDAPDRLHEVKYDGFRLLVHRDGDRVRLLTRNGHDWSGRYPWIVESALKNRTKQFVIDGEAVVLGVNGVSDFQGAVFPQARQRGPALRLRLLAMDGEDLRQLPLSLRKINLARLLARRSDGIFVAPYLAGRKAFS